MNGISSPPVSLDLATIKEVPDFVLPYNYKCELCKEILLHPMQTQCGHRLCVACLERHLLENGDPALCPYGEEDCELISRKDNTVFPDFVLIKDLKEKEVYCKYKDKGCKEIYKLGAKKAHEDRCQYGKVDCPNVVYGCTYKPKMSNLERHRSECPFTPRECPQCGNTVGKAALKDHMEYVCPKTMSACLYQCEEGPFSREERDRHLETCTKRPISCKYTRMGCDFVGSEENIRRHVQRESDMHLQLVTDHCEKLEKWMKEMEHTVKESGTMDRTRLNSLEETCKLVTQKCKRQEHRMKETEKVVVDQEDILKELQRKLELGASSAPALAGASNEDSKSKIEVMVKHIHKLEKNLEDSTKERRSLEEKVNQLTQKVNTYDLRFQVLETASYNGTLLWKIRDYTRRKMDAKNGGILSLYSQPFYTSRHGYRMCARVYLNGDGMGADSHMSLFFVVMRGEYDPLLKWPFRQRVSLMLMDQTNAGRNMVDTFRPDPSSSSFQLPVSDMNVASGCPLFISHSVLEAPDSTYLRKETIFIKIVVDVPDNAI